MKIQKLEESPLHLSKEDIQGIFAPYITYQGGPSDAVWLNELRHRTHKFRKMFWRRHLLNLLPKQGRTKVKIEEEYNEVWDQTLLHRYKLPLTETSDMPWSWREERYFAHRFGGTRIRLAVLMQVINQLRPASVLEVGAGNGVNLLYLAGGCPQIRFTGVELTKAGVRTACNFQREWQEFPEDNLAFSPFPQMDRTAFRRVEFQQGSAEALPFASGSFDLVITVMALEQMERIRHRALSEISRVTSNHVLMIEPFRDVNASGFNRHYIISQNYFSARIDDLRQFGLEPLWATADFPQKAQMQFCCVLSRKKHK